MSKKSITIAWILLIIILVIGCENKDKNEVNTKPEKVYTHKDLNPISKESVISILKAEYGESIATTVEDITSIGDEYVVEVYLELKDDEESEELHSELGEHTHRESLGEHRINMYTGEILDLE